MKALSIKQPYVELILQGRKTIEIRKWNTNFRGKFLVHASKNPDEEAMKKFSFHELDTGCIVGKAELIDVKQYKNEPEFLKDKDKHLADFKFGNHGFVLKNAERIKPIPCKGKLNFWNYKAF
ncbi:MAG: ASCH domain-containing protein [Nanoarchaeota archaeon]